MARHYPSEPRVAAVVERLVDLFLEARQRQCGRRSMTDRYSTVATHLSQPCAWSPHRRPDAQHQLGDIESFRDALDDLAARR